MDIPNHATLLKTVETFCERHKMAETRFGRDAINNPNFIRGLREGVSPTLDTLTKVAAFMSVEDERAATQAKLHAPLELTEAAEAEQALPFGTAPVNRTGASSPTCSPTAAPQATPAASASCPCSASNAAEAAPEPGGG